MANPVDEFYRLMEEEQEKAEKDRQTEAVLKRMTQLTQAQAEEVAGLVFAYENATRAGAAWRQNVERIGGVMKSLASGDIGNAVGGAFAWMAERGKNRDGSDKPATFMNAVGTWGGVVVGAFQAIAGAAQGLVGMLKSGSPAFAAAWGEMIENLLARIGVHLIPVLLPLAANIMLYSKTIAQWAGSLAVAIRDAIAFIYNLINGTNTAAKTTRGAVSGALAGAAAGALATAWMGPGALFGAIAGGIFGAGVGGASGYADSKGVTPPKFGGGPGGDDSAPSPQYIRMLEKFVGSMEANMGDRPRFESVTSAWERLMQQEAGTSDLKRETYELIREQLDVAKQTLAEAKKRAKDFGQEQPRLDG